MELTNAVSNIVVLEHTQNDTNYKLIDIESLTNSYDLHSIHEELENICKLYNASKEDLIIAAQESSVIMDKSLLNTAKALLSEGYKVSLIPISENHIISKYGDYCLEQAYQSGEYDYWIYHQFANFLNEEKIDGQEIPSAFLNSLAAVEMAFKYDYNKILNYLLTKAPIAKYSKEQILQWKKDGLSPREIVERSTQFPADPFFQAATFNVGNMHDKDFIRGLEKQNARYQRAYKFVDDPSKLINSSKAMENEHNFNVAKDRTKRKLNILSKRLDTLDVVGVNDDNIADTQKRIESLSKLVDRETFPKTWLAKKIAWLRGLYRKLMYKCTLTKSNDPIVNVLKKIGGVILRTIDKLALKLQNAVN